MYNAIASYLHIIVPTQTIQTVVTERKRTLQWELDNWNRYLNLNPHLPHIYIRRGMAKFKIAHIDGSIYDFDCAEHLDGSLTPYLWQRGIAYYYANRFEAAANQFDVGLTINGSDIEQTIWHYLSLVRTRGTAYARKHLFPLEGERPPTLTAIYNLCSGHMTPEQVLTVGRRGGDRGRFYSHLYIGLYCDAYGRADLAQQYVTTAITKYPIDDYMWYVAMVHQSLRS